MTNISSFGDFPYVKNLTNFLSGCWGAHKLDRVNLARLPPYTRFGIRCESSNYPAVPWRESVTRLNSGGGYSS